MIRGRGSVLNLTTTTDDEHHEPALAQDLETLSGEADGGFATKGGGRKGRGEGERHSVAGSGQRTYSCE